MFVGPRGPAVVVDRANDGSRLQAFAMRQFRERWQGEAAREIERGGAGSSGAKRAHAAAKRGALLVDGSAAAGRRVLRSGEVVELNEAAAPPIPDAPPPPGQSGVRQRRMVTRAHARRGGSCARAQIRSFERSADASGARARPPALLVELLPVSDEPPADPGEPPEFLVVWRQQRPDEEEGGGVWRQQEEGAGGLEEEDAELVEAAVAELAAPEAA